MCLFLNLLNQRKWSQNIMFFNHCCQGFIVSSFFQRSSFTFSIPARHSHQKFTLNVIYLKLLLFYYPSYILLLFLCLAIELINPYQSKASNPKVISDLSLLASIQSIFKSFQIRLPKKGSDHSNLLLVNLLCPPYG